MFTNTHVDLNFMRPSSSSPVALILSFIVIWVRSFFATFLRASYCTRFVLAFLVPLRHTFVYKMIYSVVAIKLTSKTLCFIFCTIESTTIHSVHSPTWTSLENIYACSSLKWFLHHCRLACSFCVSVALRSCVCVCLGLYNNVCTAHHCFRITDLKWCTNNLTIVFFLCWFLLPLALLPLLQLYICVARQRDL